MEPRERLPNAMAVLLTRFTESLTERLDRMEARLARLEQAEMQRQEENGRRLRYRYTDAPRVQEHATPPAVH